MHAKIAVRVTVSMRGWPSVKKRGQAIAEKGGEVQVLHSVLGLSPGV